jgi:hypothetical protein
VLGSLIYLIFVLRLGGFLPHGGFGLAVRFLLIIPIGAHMPVVISL